MSEFTDGFLAGVDEAFKANYDEEITIHIQKKALKIIDFIGLENAKKLSTEQVQNMIMATR